MKPAACRSCWALLGTHRGFEGKISHGLNADILVLSGGVSDGDYDFTKAVFRDLGAEMNFWKLAIRPGQPLAFGKNSGKAGVRTSGESGFFDGDFEQLVRPAMLKPSGARVMDARCSRRSFRRSFQTNRSAPFSARRVVAGRWRIQGQDDRRSGLGHFNLHGQKRTVV